MAETPPPPGPRRYRRQRRESAEERAAKMQEYRVVADLVRAGVIPDVDLGQMLTAAWQQRQAEVAANVPTLVEDDGEPGTAAAGPGWSSATTFTCPSCLSAFRWPRRPPRVDECPLCEAPNPAPTPPEVVEPVRAERVRDLPAEVKTVGPREQDANLRLDRRVLDPGDRAPQRSWPRPGPFPAPRTHHGMTNHAAHRDRMRPHEAHSQGVRILRG